MKHARSLVRRVCTIAGDVTCIDDLQDGAIVTAVEAHDTAAIFDWLMRMLSYQGISDADWSKTKIGSIHPVRNLIILGYSQSLSA
jgi:hypothetical protein